MSRSQSTKRRKERNRCRSHGWDSAFKVPPATEKREQRKALAGDGVTGKSAWQREEHGETDRRQDREGGEPDGRLRLRVLILCRSCCAENLGCHVGKYFQFVVFQCLLSKSVGVSDCTVYY